MVTLVEVIIFMNNFKQFYFKESKDNVYKMNMDLLNI